MYHAVVRRKARHVFARLSAGDTAPMIATLADPFEYRFAGTGALGGSRRTTADMEAWWARVFRLFPAATFTVRQVVVAGWPWSTQVVTHVSIRSAPDAIGPYDNEFVQLMELRWGKAIRIFTLEDTARLGSALQSMSAAGVAEASAAPIETVG